MTSEWASCTVHVVALDACVAAQLRRAPGFADSTWRSYRSLQALPKALAALHEFPVRVLVAVTERAQLPSAWCPPILVAQPRARVLVAVAAPAEDDEAALLTDGACAVLMPPWPALGALARFRDSAYLTALFPGAVPPSRREVHDLAIASRRELLPGLIQILCERFDAFCYPQSMVRSDLPLLIDEAVTNAMAHGNRWDPTKSVRVRLTLTAEAFTLEVTDQGAGFQREAVPSPLTPENRLRGGGRGLFLMESLVDTVRYEDGGRRIVLEKQLRAPLVPAQG